MAPSSIAVKMVKYNRRGRASGCAGEGGRFTDHRSIQRLQESCDKLEKSQRRRAVKIMAELSTILMHAIRQQSARPRHIAIDLKEPGAIQ